MDHSQSEPSVSPSNVVQLVGNFLTAHAVLDAEQTTTKAVETAEPASFLETLQVSYC